VSDLFNQLFTYIAKVIFLKYSAEHLTGLLKIFSGYPPPIVGVIKLFL
jgi:hypothetical protein